MINRIFWAYLGSLGLPLLYLPITFLNDPAAFVHNLHGQLLSYATFFASCLGIIIALADHDSRQHINNRHKLYRSIFATLLLCVFLGAMLVINRLTPTANMIERAWLIVPLISPLWVAPVSDMAFGKKD